MCNYAPFSDSCVVLMLHMAHTWGQAEGLRCLRSLCTSSTWASKTRTACNGGDLIRDVVPAVVDALVGNISAGRHLVHSVPAFGPCAHQDEALSIKSSEYVFSLQPKLTNIDCSRSIRAQPQPSLRLTHRLNTRPNPITPID